MAACRKWETDKADMKSLDISIVIPSFNSVQTIEKCLDSIVACGEPQPREIIVIDSGTDGTGILCKEGFPKVQYHHSPNRLFPGAARNIGWRRASSRIIAFLDSDCMVEHNWLKNMAKAHQKNYDVVTGSFAMANPEDPFGFVVFCAELAASLPCHPPGPSRLAPSGNTSYKRQVLEITGGFKEDILCEDTILAGQLIEQGKHIQFTPDIKVFHVNRKGHSAFKSALYRSGYYSGIARKLFGLKGYFFARFPLLIPVLLPYRCFNVYLVNRKSGNPYRGRLLSLFPLVVWGMLIWTVAFWNGVKAAKNRLN